MQIPNEIAIALTGKCNLSCEFCFNKRLHSGPQKDLPLDKVLKVIRDAAASGVKAIRLTGGEPLLRKDLLQIVQEARRLKLYTILNTNGLLINSKNRHIFQGVDLVLFSLHSLTSFKKVRKALHELKDFPLQVMLATIATPKNIKQLGRYYSFVNSLRVVNFKEWFLLRPVPNKNGAIILSTKDIYSLYCSIRKFNKEFSMDIKIANALPFCAIPEDLSSICKGGFFDSGYSRLFIDCRGMYKTDYSSKHSLGSIINKDIMQIWNSNFLRDIRSFKYVKQRCKPCFYLDRCKGGLLYGEYLQDFSNLKPLVSVIIPTFQAPERLSLLIKSLKFQTFKNFEIIIVDDGSIDDTKKIVKSLKNKYQFPIRYSYLPNTNIFGAGIARNYGAKMAKGRILIFLDQDTVAHNRLIENHLDCQRHADIVLGYIAGYNDTGQHYTLSQLKSHMGARSKSLPIFLDFRDTIFNNPGLYIKSFWKYFVSANFSIKKELFMDFLFDEHLTQWGAEDIDLGYRLQRNDCKVNFTISCLVYNSTSHNISDRFKCAPLMRSLIYMYNKYKTQELKEYCLERFYRLPLIFRHDSDILLRGAHLEFKEPVNHVFVRANRGAFKKLYLSGKTRLHFDGHNNLVVIFGEDIAAMDLRSFKEKLRILTRMAHGVSLNIEILKRFKKTSACKIRKSIAAVVIFLKHENIVMRYFNERSFYSSGRLT